MTATGATGTVDLQLHSTASDGSVAPEAIAAVAFAAQISAFALTDHDSIAGLGPAGVSANALGIRLVPGVELSATHGGKEVHLLGLHVGALDILDETLARFREQRVERAVAIVAKLQALGIAITVDDVRQHAGIGAVGRPHIARALIAAGACGDFREAFGRFLGVGRPGYVAKPVLTVRDAVTLVHDVGGIAVWAHPGRDGRREALEQMMAYGLDGAEVLHPGHTPDDVERLGTLCDYLGLVPSGGSDWHGESAGYRTLGVMKVPAEWLALQDARVAVRRGAGVS